MTAAPKSLPQRVGRYDIVGHLASGGMAEILLGKIVGPSGFQRPVVIKRILPHLARQDDFVQMFLDEARIVAGIRHTNVVNVNELGHEKGELFMVMEYLDGENAAGLMRRLHVRGERLDFGLCAYLVAEACAGLHAAHELADPNTGKKLGIVHRDVSPHNLFITYDGRIKVIDFGIATAGSAKDADKPAESDQFRGKFQYSSPEQCKGHILDRRSDVFSLGTVLWELSTGVRLFKRPEAVDTLKAVLELPIPAPSAIVPDYPEELAAIAMRALSRKRSGRYQTALEMRHELLGVMRKLAVGITPEEDLGKIMHGLFPERIEEKAEMLRRVQEGTSVRQLPTTEIDVQVEIPIAKLPQDSLPPPVEDSDLLSDPGVGSLSGRSGTGDPTAVIVRPNKSRRLSIIAFAGGILAVVLAGTILIALSSKKPPPPKVAATMTAEPSAEPSAAPSASVAEAPSSTASEDPAGTTTELPDEADAAVAEEAADAAADEVVVHVDTSPSKAYVSVGGKRRGVSPLDLHLPKGQKAVMIEVWRPGYSQVREKVVPDMNQKLKLTLPFAGTGKPQGTSSGGYHRFD